MNSILEIHKLKKRYKNSDFELKINNLNVYPSEVIGLIGGNGSGKSTLINLLSGNKFPDNGTIHLLGRDLYALNNKDKENLGVAFDDLRIPSKLNINQINEIFKKIYSQWDVSLYFKIVKQFNLPLYDSISTFSRGMRMKLSLIIAISHKSRLLVLDEITSGVDVSGREEIQDLLNDYQKNNNSIIITSHITEDIEKLASILVFMKNGSIIFQEYKNNIKKNYGIIIDSSNMNNYDMEDIVAFRKYKQNTLLLTKNKKKFNADPIKNIEEVIKIIMKGEVL
ncbi:ATP-binding cassette domain-containing protein [Staphylococcus sp. HKU1]|uniref:ATP-binding cassette domain-containing protein n=1 Tax=Staphylococcus sp. HKU1 TaxID=3068989 RepID=UPI003AAC1F49